MMLPDALNMYKLPYQIVNTTTAGGFNTYTLSPAGAGATISRLQARIKDINKATGRTYEIIDNENGLFLRCLSNTRAFYDYFDYNGHIDYNDPKVPFIVGFTPAGGIITDTLEDARHLLVAGTTGSGKSIFLHNLIFTFACNPVNELYLIDRKKVELSVYKPCAMVATDVYGEISAARITAHFIDEMEKRYDEIDRYGLRDFMEYKQINPAAKRKILVIDELSDLIGDKETRKLLVPRLLSIAQKGRAAGFHLILATQRPDHTVIDGTLKGNLPTRVAFNTISATDSRVILDRTGAEKLTGNGDGLYLKNAALYLERIQAPYIDFNAIKHYIDVFANKTA